MCVRPIKTHRTNGLKALSLCNVIITVSNMGGWEREREREIEREKRGDGDDDVNGGIFTVIFWFCCNGWRSRARTFFKIYIANQKSICYHNYNTQPYLLNNKRVFL